MRVGLDDDFSEVLSLQCSPSHDLSVRSSSHLTKRGRLDQVGFLFAVTPSSCLGFGRSSVCLSHSSYLEWCHRPIPHQFHTQGSYLIPVRLQRSSWIPIPCELMETLSCWFFFLPDYLRNFTPTQVAPFLRHPQAHGCLDKVSARLVGIRKQSCVEQRWALEAGRSRLQPRIKSCLSWVAWTEVT